MNRRHCHLENLEAEFYAVQQKGKESVEDCFCRLYAIYEKIVHQQQIQNFQVMLEKQSETDLFLSYKI